MKHAIITLFCLGLVAQASETDPHVVHALSLDQALAWAAGSHPDLAGARADVRAAGGLAAQAGRWPNPALVARLESVPFDRGPVDTSEYIAGVSQSIPLGRRLSRAREAGQAQQASLSQTSRLVWQRIARQVRQAYAVGLYQDRAAQLQSQVMTNAAQAVAIAQARYEAGDTSEDQVARAQIAAARAQTEARRSQSLRQQAITSLLAAMGNPGVRIDRLDGSLEEAFEIPVIEEMALRILGHPELNVARAQEQAAMARLDLASAQRIPDINVEFLYRRIEGLDANTFDVGLRIPLPAWNGNRDRIVAAQAELEAAQIRSRAKAAELGRRVELAQNRLNTALATARSLKTDVVPQSQAIRAVMEKRLAAGDISLTEFLPVERDWASVQVTYLESLRDVMVAWAEVRSALNLDPEINRP
jgi:cobalt-zinc-cadmium efflux system outer membrane protein